MKNWKYILLSVILFPLVGMVSSCSEDTEAEGEFDNWQEKNEKVLDQWAANSSYRKILTFSKDESTTMSFKNTDFIYVEVLESGDGTETPLYTDTCRVAYRGHYIPTVSYPEGLVFDQNYLDDFNWMLGYGKSDYSSGSNTIPGYSNLVFEIALYDFWHPGEYRSNFKSR